MATSSSNAVATFSSVFSITMDPNSTAVLTTGLEQVASNVKQIDNKLNAARITSAEAAADKIRKSLMSEQEVADYNFVKTIQQLQQLKAQGLLAESEVREASRRAGLAFQQESPVHKELAAAKQAVADEAAWRAQLAAKHAQQMSSAGLGAGMRAGGARGLEEQLQADNAVLAAAAEWRERLAAKHAAQMASAGLGAGKRAGVMQDIGAEARAEAAAKTANIIAQVRAQQASRDAADAMMLSMRREGEQLKWHLMTEKERFAVRRQADLDHLNMLLRFQSITQQDFEKLSLQAGRLGLGNIAADNNMRNRGFTGAMIAQQLGFGVQDFMSQMTNSKTVLDGMGRGVMALSNNVQMMGAAWGHVGLAVTAISGTLIGVALPAVLKWLDTTKQLLDLEEKRAERQRELMELQDEARNRASGVMGRGAGGEMPTATAQQTVDALKLQEKQAWDEVRAAKRQAAILTAEESRLERQQARELGRSAWGPFATLLGTSVDDRLAEVRKRIKEEQTTIEELEAAARASGVAGLSPEEASALNRRFLDERTAKTEQQKKDHEEDVKRWAANAAAARKRQLQDTKEAIDDENELRRMEIEKNRIAIEEIAGKGGTSPLGMSAMSVAGTAAAASAINRALAGSRSEESDRKRQIQELEKINKKLEIENRKGSLEKAMLPQA